MEAGVGISWVVILSMALMQGGGGDLLDYVDTDAYWKEAGVEVTVESMVKFLVVKVEPDERIAELINDLADEEWQTRDKATKALKEIGPKARPALERAAKSKDPEVTMRAETILKNLGAAKATPDIRRLMAIRTLGELRKQKSLPALKPMLASKEPFVADYAAEAIAKIEGRDYTRATATDAEIKADLGAVLPGATLIGQAKMKSGSVVDYEKILKAMDLPRRGGGAPPTPGEAAEMMTRQILEAATWIGNVRPTCVTVGMSGDPDRGNGYVMIVGRGTYDSKAVAGVLASEAQSVSKVDGIDVYSDADILGMCPSDGRMVVLMGEREKRFPVTDVVARLKRKKSSLEADPVIAKLLASVDKTRPIWLVMKVTPPITQLPIIGQFKTITATVDEKDGHSHFHVVARGDDPEKIRQALATMEEGRAEGVKLLSAQVENMPVIQTFVDFLESVEVKHEGTKVTVTAVLKAPPAGALSIMPMMFFGIETRAHRAVVVEQQAVPVPR